MMTTQKPTLIVTALAVCLLMSACGSSKSSNGGGASPTTTTTLPVSKAPELPPVVDPNVSAADREKNDTDEQDNSGSGTVINAPTKEEIETMQNEASRYTGSSDDGLRELLLSKIDQETDQIQKAKNLKFAFNIISAYLKPTPKGSKIQLILRMVDTSKDQKIGSKKITYSGLLSSQKKSNRIELQSRDKDGKIIEKQKGALICLDENRPRMIDCQTKLAKVYLDKAEVQIILRRGVVYTHGEFGNRQCVTEACETMYGLLRNTQDEVKDGNSILQSSMETFEIIQGRSGFNILIISRDNEILKFAGSLPGNEKYDETRDQLTQKLSSDERIDPVTKKLRKTKLNDSLGYIRLQSNDEKGQLKVKVSMPFIEKDEVVTRDEFDLIFTRELRPLRASIDERSKTSSSK